MKGDVKHERTPEQTSHIMKQIKCKDSEIEKRFEKNSGAEEFDMKNAKDVYGKPDLVFKSKKVACCDSEFWHGFEWEQRKQDFKINKEYWIPKIEKKYEERY